MNVPFVDLKANYNSIKSEIDSAIQTVIDKTTFIKGEYVENFEEKFLKEFNEQPNYISLLSYDLIGLIYYLSKNF